MIFFGSLKKLVLAEFFETELLENVTEPSRVEPFDQKLEPNTSQTEPSLGSGATLLFILSFKSSSFIDLEFQLNLV